LHRATGIERANPRRESLPPPVSEPTAEGKAFGRYTFNQATKSANSSESFRRQSIAKSATQASSLVSPSRGKHTRSETKVVTGENEHNLHYRPLAAASALPAPLPESPNKLSGAILETVDSRSILLPDQERAAVAPEFRGNLRECIRTNDKAAVHPADNLRTSAILLPASLLQLRKGSGGLA